MTEADTASVGEALVAARHVVIAVCVSIGGLLVHNLEEFPPSILLAPETLVPATITILIGVAMLRHPSTVAFATAAGWAVIVIIVGGASVLSLPIWPFTPEQTVSHYAAHAIYALAQLPLLWVAWRGVRTTRSLN